MSAAALGPAALWRRADARAATAGGIVGLLLFAALTLVAALPGAARSKRSRGLRARAQASASSRLVNVPSSCAAKS